VIRYALKCNKGHEFESWFKNSSAYDRQSARGLISCPVCGSTAVEKTIMAPALAGPADHNESIKPSSETPVAMLGERERALRAKLKELRDHITTNADYVGRKFPEQARSMHYGEIDHRSIYGEASTEEAQSLIEEGIEVHRLPRLPDDQN